MPSSGFAIVLAALVGPSLVAPDLANGALSLYFSRPQSRTEYIVARMLVLVGLLSLITWFLIPARREVLLLGKYLAGLIASIGIFSFGAALCYLVMLWPQEAAARAAFWPDPGLSHLLWYCAASALACVGYGSVFLAAGLLLRNPIIPAVVILFWEGLNPVLPALLQKLSVLYYVQALTPVPAPHRSRSAVTRPAVHGSGRATLGSPGRLRLTCTDSRGALGRGAFGAATRDQLQHGVVGHVLSGCRIGEDDEPRRDPCAPDPPDVRGGSAEHGRCRHLSSPAAHVH